MSIQLEQTIRQRIASVANIPEARVTADSTLADLMIDSLATVEVLVDLQEEFDVLLEEDDLEHLVTVADLVGLVERHRRAGLHHGD